MIPFALRTVVRISNAGVLMETVIGDDQWLSATTRSRRHDVPETTASVRSTRTDDRQRVHRVAARRPRGVHLRRARQGCHVHPAFRNTARMIARLYDALHDPAAQGSDPHADRHRKRRRDARVLQGAEDAGGSAAGPIGDRGVGAAHLRVDRPFARLQGVVPGDARRKRRLLCAVSGERAPLVPLLPGTRAVRQSRDHPSTRRSRSSAERSRAMSACTSKRKPTPASSSPARRSWRQDRCSPTSRSSRTTG